MRHFTVDDLEYFNRLKEMRARYKKWDGKPYSPYYFDEGAYFPMTVIERNLWSDIRAYGIPIYYQFPIGKYYVDFVDPFHRLVVETDGKFHKNQVEKDAKRDKYIRSLGFDVLRIEGKDTFDLEVKEDNEVIFTCEALKKVREWYYDRNFYLPCGFGSVPSISEGFFNRWKATI